MIQANELRLGNYFLNPNTQKAQQCTCEDISDIQNGYKTRLPIPLTPEMLEKRFGFEKDNEGYLYKQVPYGVDCRVYWMDGFLQLVQNKIIPIHNYTHITNLHTLQNWWYFTYNEELNIQL